MEDINDGLVGHRFPLPTEIIVEILSRLPVKCLCRFRCVSKPWRSLISNTKFSALHANKTIEDEELFLRRRRVLFNVECRGLYSMDLDEYLRNHTDNPHDSPVTATEPDFVRKEFHPKKQHITPWIPFIYFCNNFLLCYNKDGDYLVNPATRQMKKVPMTPRWRPSPAVRSGFSICGLGFDYSTNEYKVVDGQIYKDKGVIYSVYTLKTDSWRQIECRTQYRPTMDSGIFLNGAIHWSAVKADAVHDRKVILTFLLAEEEFCEIQVPRPIAHICPTPLRVFRDCLCLTLIGIDKTYDEFWVMKEYRVSESWTKMRVSLPYTSILSPIGFFTKSHDLMVYEDSLVVYDSKKGSIKKLRIRDIPKIGNKIGNSVGVYVEGLFPLTDHCQ